MCGILGALSTQNRPLDFDDSVFRRALLQMKHRGPDDSGIWWSREHTAALGHQRLSILDLSPAGKQPMTNDTGSIWATFNGEIYNFKEIRADLVKRGYRFRSQTDTEVLVHGYEEFGKGIVQRLRGMFAFAIFDTKTGQALLARDPAGIKPLYYCFSRNRLLFASEIGPLLEFPGVEKALELHSLQEYMAFGKAYSPGSLFRGILRLPSASYGILKPNGQWEITKYWSPYRNRLSWGSEPTEQHVVSAVRDAMEESVQAHSVSDVPMGVFLSGGLDSSLNLALLAKKASGTLASFTCGFAGQEKYDERAAARWTAKYYKSEHFEVELTRESFLDSLPELSNFLDEPVADPTTVPFFHLAKLARRQGVPVVLNGDGGDELFCGYNRYGQYLKTYPAWRAYQWLPRPLRSGFANLAKKTAVPGALADALERSALGLEYFVGGTSAYRSSPLSRGSDFMRSNPEIFRSVRAARAQFEQEKLSGHYAEWLSYWGLQSEVEHEFLYRADRLGMASSVEIRVPFLDQKIIEFSLQMPQHLKHQHGQGKYVLRKAMEGTLPEEILKRPKIGFCVPVREWAGKEIERSISVQLPRLQRDWGGMDQEFITSLEAGSLPLGKDPFLAWQLYSLSAWYARWFS